MMEDLAHSSSRFRTSSAKRLPPMDPRLPQATAPGRTRHLQTYHSSEGERLDQEFLYAQPQEVVARAVRTRAPRPTKKPKAKWKKVAQVKLNPRDSNGRFVSPSSKRRKSTKRKKARRNTKWW